jgi:putative hydrolase of the HAD superfamily
VPATLERLRGGARLAVVSNWDVSLHDVLERTGLRGLVDVVVISSELGVAKPDPAIFRAALDRLGPAPQTRCTSATASRPTSRRARRRQPRGGARRPQQRAARRRARRGSSTACS